MSLIFTASDLGFQSKMTIGGMLVFFSLILQIRYQPYISSKMNKLETLSLSAANLTFFSGFLLVYDLPESLKFILTILVIIPNIYFLLRFTQAVLWIYISQHITFLSNYCCYTIVKAFALLERGKQNISTYIF